MKRATDSSFLPTRRDLFQIGAVTLAGYHLLPQARPLLAASSKKKVSLRGSAEQVLFIMLNGGMSQIDTWDLREGPWTPSNWDIQNVRGTRWPMKLFPKLAGLLERVTLVRSLASWEASHARAQYYLQVGHIMNPARRGEMPGFGSVIAYEFQGRRKPSDFLPGYFALNMPPTTRAGLIGSGFLGPKVSPLPLLTESLQTMAVPEAAKPELERRFEVLQRLNVDVGRAGAPVRIVDDLEAFARGAHAMIRTPRLAKLLQIDGAERKTYGGSSLGDACILARNLLRADAGARYVMISHDSWDTHEKHIERQTTLCHDLDEAFAALIADMDAAKDRQGRSLLDKTLVVCMGEFGRTVGPLTQLGGRDHWPPAMSGIFIGGGVKPGQILGATNKTGDQIADPGWHQGRSIYYEDLIATIYSTLGIDWTKKLTGTPSGRAFQYIEPASGTEELNFTEVKELFG